MTRDHVLSKTPPAPQQPHSNTTRTGAGLLRRLASLLYDVLLLVAILFVATACLLPFNGGEALQPGQWLYSAYLLALVALFFGWFWTHGGQTLGMKAWGLRVCRADGRPLAWRHAGLRMLASCVSFASLGLGYLWVVVDPQRLAWHDRLSGTRLVRVEQRAADASGRRGNSGASEQSEQCEHQRE